MDKVIRGYKLFLEGKVELTSISPNSIQFKAEGNNDTYFIDITRDFAWCSCKDYTNRWNRTSGSYFCYHIYAALFKLKEYMDKSNKGK
jgi:predicted nucleic acid-binding Zn finger protein